MEFWKGIANIFFFLTVGIIGILSYFQARKTLFSPIKTEIFKLQIDAFQDVLGFFHKNQNRDFDKIFGFHEIVNINALYLRQAFIELFFKDKIQTNKDFLDDLKKKSYGRVYKLEEDLEELSDIVAGSELMKKELEDKKIEDPSLKLATWNNYKPSGVIFTKQYSEAKNIISNIAASPLLPRELKDLIYQFIDDVDHNLGLIREVLIDASKELPLKYKTVDDVIKMNLIWVWNLYNDRRKDLAMKSEEILNFVNEYLKIKDIMK